MQTLDKCGAIPNKDIDCLKSKCPFWDIEKDMCVLDVASSMIANVDILTKMVTQKWLSMNNNQRLDMALGLAKKIGLL
jgi:hypothetical protein